VAIDVHGPLDRAKDVVLERGERILGVSATSACAWAHADTFPSSASRGHLLSPVRLPARERAPYRRDGPAKTHVPQEAREGCRHPVNQGAFHRCDDGHARGSLHRFPCRPPAHAAHTLAPWLGTSALMGIASVARGMTARDVVLRLRESRTPLQPH